MHSETPNIWKGSSEVFDIKKGISGKLKVPKFKPQGEGLHSARDQDIINRYTMIKKYNEHINSSPDIPTGK